LTRFTFPSIVVLRLKVTLPVGVPEPSTVAVNVTAMPKFEGFNDEFNWLVVANNCPTATRCPALRA